ncbi:RluA family pseudouridine synthase [Limibacillus sp. MBR-115]|jgi:23S rRNA pseudouridine955/2504/2580 synthase|uniref:RluA family pseudouridine synthase n=1 Tax=Limibacillus sp. MBR-115 TaxID=3156465 RepID=UPI003399D456
MTGVENRKIADGEGDQRLDRWFKQHYPNLPFGKLAKLLRTGQIRVDGKRAKNSTRLEVGQIVRVPPLEAGDLGRGDAPTVRDTPRVISKADQRVISDLQAAVLFKDDWVLAINKPAGLAVQGGTKQDRHVDALLDHLRFDASERPRLVHRLDKDTSGVLLLARSAAAARSLAAVFRGKDAEKTYWAIVVGLPRPNEGRIEAALTKGAGPNAAGQGNERVWIDPEEGQRAVTLYRTLDHAGKKAALLELQPITGRTHQLRAHCAGLGTPILGDGKYGGADAYIEGMMLPRRMHLHARDISLPHPSGNGSLLRIHAPLSAHMVESLGLLGLDGTS